MGLRQIKRYLRYSGTRPESAMSSFCLAFARMLQTFTWKSVVFAGVARVSWMRNSRKVGRAVRYSPHHQLCAPHAKRHIRRHKERASAPVFPHIGICCSQPRGSIENWKSLGFLGHESGEQPLSGRAFHLTGVPCSVACILHGGTGYPSHTQNCLGPLDQGTILPFGSLTRRELCILCGGRGLIGRLGHTAGQLKRRFSCNFRHWSGVTREKKEASFQLGRRFLRQPHSKV